MLDIASPTNTTQVPSSAFTLGLIYSPKVKESKFEYGLIFKNLDSEDTGGNKGLTGGLFVRYKFL